MASRQAFQRTQATPRGRIRLIPRSPVGYLTRLSSGLPGMHQAISWTGSNASAHLCRIAIDRLDDLRDHARTVIDVRSIDLLKRGAHVSATQNARLA